jgi:GTP-binding protein
MSKKINYPKVIFVGRTNVGKSTLFNRLINKKKSIVFPTEGVTRDYVQETITWNDVTFELIDTGGYSFKRAQNDITKRVQEKVTDLLQSSDILLFVCDGKNGLVNEDKLIAKIIHKLKKPTALLINKADNTKALEENLSDFYALGFKTIITVSGIHSIGIRTLLDFITDTLGTQKEIKAQEIQHKIVIIGKPNVGKSSLMNLLARHERSIISPVPGTTREAISHPVFYCHDLIQLTDTPGVRKHAKVTEDLEELMVKSSLGAVREADTILVMIDASQGKISDQELKLLFYAYEQKKKILALFNKIDLLNEYTEKTLKSSCDEYKFILNKLSCLFVSCITQKNIPQIFNELKKIWALCSQEFNSSEVNEYVQEALKNKPFYHNRIQLKIFKIRNIKSQIPTFVLHVNYPEWFGQAQIGCIENILRTKYSLKGCPLQFHIRGV